MLKTAVKGIAGSLGYDVIRKNNGGAAVSRGLIARFEAEYRQARAELLRQAA